MGKTALAVAIGNQAKKENWFSYALFIDLRGYDQSPMSPQQAVSAFLRTLGVPRPEIPSEINECTTLFRMHLNNIEKQQGAPVLVVADNASGANQVRALIPGHGGHRLLVTSRNRITTLGAPCIRIECLSDSNSVKLITKLLSRANPSDPRINDISEMKQIARACGNLPIALQISSAVLINYQSRSILSHVSKLMDANSRLQNLADDERQIQAIFDTSISQLSPDQNWVFTLLGAAPGHSFTVPAISALTNKTDDYVTELMDELSTFHLVTRNTDSNQWSMHDLLADYASSIASEKASDKNLKSLIDEALERIIDYYLKTAEEANLTIRHRPKNPSIFSTPDEAFSWLENENANLAAVVQTSREVNNWKAAIRLPEVLSFFLRDHFVENFTMHDIIQYVETRAGGRHQAAATWNIIGFGFREARKFENAITAHNLALDHCKLNKDIQSEAAARHGLGLTYRQLKRIIESIESHELALALCLELGDRHSEAWTLHGLGLSLADAGRTEDAMTALERAEKLYIETKDDSWLAICRIHLSHIQNTE